jgi:hypothetical protein
LFGVAVVPDKPKRAFISSLQIGWPLPLLELSTSDTPLSAGDGGNEPGKENGNSLAIDWECQNISSSSTV